MRGVEEAKWAAVSEQNGLRYFMGYGHSEALRGSAAGIDNDNAAVAQQIPSNGCRQARIELNFQAGRQGHVEKVNGRMRFARQIEQRFGCEDVRTAGGERHHGLRPDGGWLPSTERQRPGGEPGAVSKGRGGGKGRPRTCRPAFSVAAPLAAAGLRSSPTRGDSGQLLPSENVDVGSVRRRCRTPL